MAFPQCKSVTVTTAADGSATAYLNAPDSNGWRGELSWLKYTKIDFDNGVDFTITSETSGQDIWVDTNINATESLAPRMATSGTDGAAALYAAAGSAVMDRIMLCGERIKIVIASGGNVKTGTFTAVVG